MKKLWLWLWLTAMTALSGGGAEPGFYVWQRVWTPAVEAAATACPRDLYVLAAEFTWQSGRCQVDRAAVPAALLRRDRVTAVYRLNGRRLDPASVAAVAAEMRRVPCRHLQLDVDCPENKLAEYAAWLTRLKTQLPDRRFSVTVLPCHLSHAEFRQLAGLTEYYVLQVHSLHVPATVNDDCRLLRREEAVAAIDRAEKLGLPFKVALPCYTYQLNFDRVTGRFAGLNADPRAYPPEQYVVRLAEVDLTSLHDILSRSPACSWIWFRLPVGGERLVLSRTTIAALEHGDVPKPKIQAACRADGSGQVALIVRSDARFGYGTADLDLVWPQPTGEFDLFGGTKNLSDNRVFGVLPRQLRVQLPGDGEECKAAVFYGGCQPTKIEVKP